MSWLKIDDVAKETGLTKRTIRYYEEIGLITPPKRSDGGVRLYTKEDIEFLKKIIDAREVLGFSLQELQKFIQVSEIIKVYKEEYKAASDKKTQINELNLLQEGLIKQLEMIDTKINKIEEFRKDIESLLLRVQQVISEKNKI